MGSTRARSLLREERLPLQKGQEGRDRQDVDRIRRLLPAVAAADDDAAHEVRQVRDGTKAAQVGIEDLPP
jgi:hypothetical protein